MTEVVDPTTLSPETLITAQRQHRSGATTPIHVAIANVSATAE
jgi:hypothetical protein